MGNYYDYFSYLLAKRSQLVSQQRTGCNTGFCWPFFTENLSRLREDNCANTCRSSSGPMISLANGKKTQRLICILSFSGSSVGSFSVHSDGPAAAAAGKGRARQHASESSSCSPVFGSVLNWPKPLPLEVSFYFSLFNCRHRRRNWL